MRTLTFSMVQPTCGFCLDWPCSCRRPVTVTCACGGTLVSEDDLEHKRMAVEAHNQHPLHETWRASQGSSPRRYDGAVTCPVAPTVRPAAAMSGRP